MRSVLLSGLKGVNKKSLETLKKAGVKSSEDLKMVDISQLSKRTGLSEQQLREILLRAELHASGVGPEVAEVLVSSGAIGRIGELAAFNVEQIQELLRKGSRRGKGKDVSIESIEALKILLPKLTLDEESTRGTLMEEMATGLHSEKVSALRSEESVISKGEVKAVIGDLEMTLHQLSDKLRAITTGPEEKVESANVQALLLSLQADIRTALGQVMGKSEPNLEVVLVEDQSPAAAEEEIELDVQIQALSQQLTATQEQLAELQKRRIAANEELSPTAGEEQEPTAAQSE